jgi:hypothetical protein
MARAKPEPTNDTPGPALLFTGARDALGRPVEFFSGIPARDLHVRDYGRLTPDQQRMVWDSPLYGAGPDAESTPRPEDDPAATTEEETHDGADDPAE